MTGAMHQFRLSTLFHSTSVVACVFGLFRALGPDGVLLLLFLASLPFLIVLIAVAYIRGMSWLFDVVFGPFLLR